MSKSKETIEIGSVWIDNDNKDAIYGKQIRIDYNGPYLSLDRFDEVRDALKLILSGSSPRSQCIAFAEWLPKNGYTKHPAGDQWYGGDGELDLVGNTAFMYELFLKHQSQQP